MNAAAFLMHTVIEINEFHSRKRSFKEVAEWKYQRYLQDYMGV